MVNVPINSNLCAVAKGLILPVFGLRQPSLHVKLCRKCLRQFVTLQRALRALEGKHSFLPQATKFRMKLENLRAADEQINYGRTDKSHFRQIQTCRLYRLCFKFDVS